MEHRCRTPAACETCRTRLRANLAALPTLYDACGQALRPAERGHTLERVSGSRTFSPVNDAAVEVRVSIQAVLASWAVLVADERRVTAPGGEVPRLVRFLTRHLDWLTAHPLAADVLAETDGLVGTALRVIDGGPAARPVELGRCVEADCGGLLLAHAGARAAGPSLVRCDTGRHVWPPYQWLPLRRRLEQQARPA